MKFTVPKNRVSVLKLLILGMLLVFFAACDSQIKDTGGSNQPQTSPPRLANLFVQSPDGPLTFNKQFSSETLNYTVPTPATIEPVTINAVVAASNVSNYSISYLPAKQLSPIAGTVAIINVLDKKSGLKENYVITFDNGELTQAAISDLFLSAGTLESEITGDNYDYTVNVPYGTERVMLLPLGAQPNTYFTYDEGTNPVVELSEDCTGSVVIGVMAQNYSQSDYTITFQPYIPEEELFSLLHGISLSSGALESAFVADPEEDDLQIIKVNSTVNTLAITAIKELPSDETYFDSAAANSEFKVFSPVVNGQTFNITVHRGGMYTDKNYKFKIVSAAEPEAILSALSFSGSGVVTGAYKRNLTDGENNGLVSSSEEYKECSEYNLNFSVLQGAATINAQAGVDFAISVAERSDITTTISDAGRTAVIAISSLLPNLAPVEITVSGEGHIPKTYYVYFKNTAPPLAHLDTLTVLGGMAACTPPLNDVLTNQNPRTVYLFANTNTVIVQGTAAAGLTVSYDPPGGYLVGTINGQTITITVSGGPGYRSGVYRLQFFVNTAQSPRLASLLVNGNTVPGFSTSRLVYEYSIENDQTGNISIPFAWTYNADEVNHVSYSLNNGDSWVPSGGGFATPPTIELEPLQSKVVLIKVKTIDGGEAVYYVTVRRKSAFKLVSLSILSSEQQSLFQKESSFSPAVSYYPITVPNDISIVKISATATPGSTVSAVENGSPYTLGGNIHLQVYVPVTVTVSIYPPQSNPTQTAASYTFVLTRERPTGFYIGTNTTPVCIEPEDPSEEITILSEEVGQPPEASDEQGPPMGGEDDEDEDPEEPQPIETLAEALAWLSTNAQSGTAYTLILGADEDSPAVVLNGTNFADQDSITFTLGALNTGTVVSLTETGALFTVGPGVNFILDRNIVLRGKNSNTNSVVHIMAGGAEKCNPTLEMKEGSKIHANQAGVDTFGGGITVGYNGTFTMRGGEISGNHSATVGGGIFCGDSTAIVKIYGGLIKNNTAMNNGGGIYVLNALQMYGGIIQNNSAKEGGGISIAAGGNAAITGGSIVQNTASNSGGNGGGGIFIASGGVVNFSGGTIENNTTSSYLGSYNIYGVDRFHNTSGQTIAGQY